MGQCMTGCCRATTEFDGPRNMTGGGGIHNKPSVTMKRSSPATSPNIHLDPPPTSPHQSSYNGSHTKVPAVGFTYPRFSLPALKPSPHSFSEQKLVSLFEHYRDAHSSSNKEGDGHISDDTDTIQYDGVERLCSDLSLHPEDFRVLILAWKLNAEHMCVFTRNEFVGGLRLLRIDSVKILSERLNEMAHEVRSDSTLFKDLYRFTFRFGLENSARSLPTVMASALWGILFLSDKRPDDKPSIIERWLKFLEVAEVKTITKDTWNMFLTFFESVGNDLSMYDDAEAWPSVLDDFVEFETDARNQNTPHFNNNCSPDNA